MELEADLTKTLSLTSLLLLGRSRRSPTLAITSDTLVNTYICELAVEIQDEMHLIPFMIGRNARTCGILYSVDCPSPLPPQGYLKATSHYTDVRFDRVQELEQHVVETTI